MRTQIIFQKAVWDTLFIRYDSKGVPCVPRDSFFDVAHVGSAPSVGDTAEGALVEWLINNPHVRELLSRELHVDSATRMLPAVSDAALRQGRTRPGDIDLVVMDPANPRRAIAVEFKRVKVEATGTHTDRVTKLVAAGKGISQANALRELGFAQTYLGILISTDGGKRTNENLLFRGPTPKSMGMIIDFDGLDGLHRDIGVLYVLIVQPNGHDLQVAGSVGVCVDRRAAEVEQRAEVSSRLREMLGRPGE